jgi:hypothetical protein
MPSYRRGAHTVFEIHLHIVWTTKYRKPVMVGEVGHRVRALVVQVCESEEVRILKGHVSKDHVHVYIANQDHEQQDGDFRVEGKPAPEGRAKPLAFSRLEPGTLAGFSRNRDFQSQTEATGLSRW